MASIEKKITLSELEMLLEHVLASATIETETCEYDYTSRKVIDGIVSSSRGKEEFSKFIDLIVDHVSRLGETGC